MDPFKRTVSELLNLQAVSNPLRQRGKSAVQLSKIKVRKD